MERVTDAANTIDVYENDIDIYLHEFIQTQYIEDMRKEPQSVWNACLMYIQRHVFSDRNNLKLKTNIQNDNSIMSSTYNAYNYELIDNILDYYIYMCNSYNKEVSIMGFSKLLGIPYTIIEEWGNNYSNSNRLSSRSSDIYKKLLSERQESLSNKLADGKQNPVGVIAILNRHYGWASPYTADSNRQKKALDAAELPRLDGKTTKLLPDGDNIAGETP